MKINNFHVSVDEQMIREPSRLVVLRIPGAFEPAIRHQLREALLADEIQRFAVRLDVEIATDNRHVIGLGYPA